MTTTTKRKGDFVYTAKKKTMAKPGANKANVTKSAVRKTLLGMAETKRFVGSDGFSTTGVTGVGSYWGYNPLYWMQQGSTDSQRIGDEIYFDKLRLRCIFGTNRGVLDPATPATWGALDPINVWVGVVKSIYQNHDGLIGPASNNPIVFPDLRHSGVGSVTNPAIDSNKVNVIWSKHITLRPNVTAVWAAAGNVSNVDNQLYELDEDIKIARQFKYNADATGYAKDYNYYIVWGYSNSLNKNNCTFKLSYEVLFKDM